MKHVVAHLALALALGSLLGLLAALSVTRLTDQTDWRASEITAWCNRYRAVATSSRQQLESLLAALSAEFPKTDEELWFLEVDRQDWELGSQILAIQRHMRSIEPWFLRCASAPLPEIPSDDTLPGAGYELVSYLSKVASAVPLRDPTDPEQYVQPLDEPWKFRSRW